MSNLPTLPRRSWLERLSLILGCALTSLGAITLAGWLLHNDAWVQFAPTSPPITANAALSVLILGVALVLAELGWAQAPWMALAPAILGLASLLEQVFSLDLHLDEFLVHDYLQVDLHTPGRMSAMVAGSLLLSSLTLVWHAWRRGSRARLFAEAATGSVAASVGFSTLLGYATSLPAVYRWGSTTATSPLDAVALMVLGLALLTLAWRDNLRLEGGPPSWSPMPFVILCLTLTIILWIGLSERERVYLGSNTQIAINSLANSTELELRRHANAVDRIAQDWGQALDNATAIWQADAIAHEQNSPACVSVAWVDLNLRTRWIFPLKGNETAVNYDHGPDPVRAAALAEAHRSGRPVISGTINLPLLGKGLAIYAPVKRDGKIVGYVAAEYLYRTFFSAIDRDLKLGSNYSTTVTIGGETVYDSISPDENRNEDHALDAIFTIADRRVRFSLAPSNDFLARNRRYLPELALFAGFGLTLLLGLSVHLARTARAGQRSAEESNKRLVAENDERRRIEARLKVSDERLRLALDSTQIGIFEWSVPSGHVYYSPGLWAMLGYEHGRMPATVEAWQSLIHPNDLPLYRQSTDSQLNGSTAFIDPEYRVRARTGEWRWVYARSKSVASTTNLVPTRIIGTVQDITARREAEDALNESQAATRKLSLVAARTDNLVMIGTTDGLIEWINDSFTRVMEYSLAEVVGRNPVDFMTGPETSPRTVFRIRAALSRGRGISTDIVNYSKSGRKYHLQLEIQPVRNKAGEVENFIAMLADITTRVDTEQALRRAKAEADTASRAKSEFLASMSHEIRTPMNGVIGMTSLLLDTNLTGEQRDFVNTIRASGEALLTIINDILDFSKIESGKMELEHLPFELTVGLEEALDLFAVTAAAKKLDLAYVVAPDVPPWVIGDVTRLRQVLVNLLNNAVKFTSNGSISIEVRRIQHRGDVIQHTWLEFTVRDTGIGIPRDRVGRLFKAFSQVDSSTTRKYGGTGLGLAICQRLCKLMGGDIRVESTVGQGSAFIFTMQSDAAALPADTGAPPLPAALHSAPLIIIEDYAITQQRLRNFFQNWGADCHIVSTAAQAVELAARLPVPPGLLLVDYREADEPGLLKTLAPLAAPRLLMLPFGQTLTAWPPDGHSYTFISKPLKTNVLVHAIVAIFTAPALPTAIINTPGAGLLATELPLKVLLAEDNLVNQKVALRFLERLGYHSTAVANGIEALAALERDHYDLVMMDLQMPEMDGLEASRQIRQRLDASRQPKIIALTANALHGDRDRCIAAGMDDYVTKPVKLHEIEAAIRRQFAPQSKKIEFIG
jgi:PAS domain S-box-containing protein